jgi:diguanylate cyclase (GGDEF)-like protein
MQSGDTNRPEIDETQRAEELARLQTLTDCDILDTAPEATFDAVVKAASFICQTPISLVSFVDERRQWFKACVGLEMTGTPLSSSFCSLAIRHPNDVFVIEDTLLDERFIQHPLVDGPPYIRFYAGFPLVTSTEHALGTLCVIDTKPRILEAAQADILRALALQVSAVLDQRAHSRATEKKLTAQSESHAALVSSIGDLERRNEELLASTLTDFLTGIGNRRGFDLTLMREHERALRDNEPLSVVMIDIDFFKKYNDDFGHVDGDQVLIEVARVLRLSVRAPEYLARYGGEEFVVILPTTDMHAAEVAAERIRTAIENNTWPQRPITVSLGIVTTTGKIDVGSLVKLADAALYHAKIDGRNRVKRADES